MNRTRSIRNVALYSIVIFLILSAFFMNRAENENQEIAITTETESAATETPREDLSIIEIISKGDEFSTLVKALQAADLVNALKGNGPFTLFAPTNAAFEQLPPGTLQNLLKPENKTKLSGILTYHIVPGRHPAEGMKSGKLKTLNSKELDIVSDGKQITVNKAKVVHVDVNGANGIIHIVDAVILPN